MVDFRGLFMDAYIGWPGNGTLFPNWKINIMWSRCKSVLLYPLHYNIILIFHLGTTNYTRGSSVPFITLAIMKPFSENTCTTESQKNYNCRQSHARMVVENDYEKAH